MTIKQLRHLAEFPDFDQIHASQAKPAFRTLIKEAEIAVWRVERRIRRRAAAAPDNRSIRSAARIYDMRVTALADAVRPLWRAWGVVEHMLSVCNSPEWRAAEEKLRPQIVAFAIRVSQSNPLHDALLELCAHPDFGALDTSKRRAAEAALLSAHHGGVGLSGAKREEFNRIMQSLAKHSARFSDNVLDATKAFSLTLTDAEDLQGLPATVLAATAQPDGSHKITLEQAVYEPFMKYSARPALRETLFKARAGRASSGALDNTQLVVEILRLRRRLARLLGYADYAHMSLADKMARTPEEASEMIARVGAAAVPKAREEFAALEKFAGGKLKPWDLAFWAARQSEALFGFTSEQLRPYFRFDKVLSGMFALAYRLFGVEISAADGAAPVWHPDVRFFRIKGWDGSPRAWFYLDPYSRPETKRGGAWMNEFQTRHIGSDGSVAAPIGLIVCNQSVPAGGKPSCMTLGEVSTLFHEFGHTLQHILTTVDDPAVSGINGVEWDAVELASQFFENWVLAPGMLESLSEHVDTGKRIPPGLAAKIRASAKHNAAMALSRQLLFASADLALHTGDAEPAPEAVLADAVARFAIMPPAKEERPLNSFTHIFAGGYAAGYYSYMWADVLAADAFEAFKEAGFSNTAKIRDIGLRFADTVLSLGGSMPPADVFRVFRGRDPDPDALLRAKGLL